MNSVTVRSRILSMLPRAEYRRLRPVLEQISLPLDAVLCAPGDAVRHVYFPNDGIVSLIHEVDERRGVEVAMEGNESAIGLSAYLAGTKSYSLSVVRDAGTAMRLAVSELNRHTVQRNALTGLLHRSANALVMQIVQSGICNRFHAIDHRLARWLLMSHDRSGSNELLATQAVIAGMIGVRRSSVTMAATNLQRQGVIHYRRGRIEILDREGLAAASCSCYERIRRQYGELLR